MIHRNIDIVRDKDFLLELHCEINYECESAWGKGSSFSAYREKWMNSSSQIEEFTYYLSKSMEDKRTIAEIIEDDNGVAAAYIWVSFFDVKDYNISIAEIREIAVVKSHRRSGIGKYIMNYIEKKSKESGANVLRSGTGYDNCASKLLHEKSGFKPYRIEYEKIL